MASSNGKIFCITDPLWGESTGDRWIPLTKASDVELWCFLWSVPEQTLEQAIKTLRWEIFIKKNQMGMLMMEHFENLPVMMSWEHILHYQTGVRGIHQSQMDSPDKVPVVWSCFYIIIDPNKLLNEELSCQWFELISDAITLDVTSLWCQGRIYW